MDNTSVINLSCILNKRLVVYLRDGKWIEGFLRTYDMYGSMLLETTKIVSSDKETYAEEKAGYVFVRGENIVLYGEKQRMKDETKANKTEITPAEMKQRKTQQKNTLKSEVDVFDCY
ncbi:MAG: U6 snRNA-associated Sm-like protein LSm1 [Amphiamblys sp. WSBS2006]|nr:MAG: U6 snRNA-associated Sm-like protein LSm1 [Amphiamblys sp. WSBS2006]